MSTESSGKPDAWKLARPVWGWGRGEIPRPTPRADGASMPLPLRTTVPGTFGLSGGRYDPGHFGEHQQRWNRRIRQRFQPHRPGCGPEGQDESADMAYQDKPKSGKRSTPY